MSDITGNFELVHHEDTIRYIMLTFLSVSNDAVAPPTPPSECATPYARNSGVGRLYPSSIYTGPKRFHPDPMEVLVEVQGTPDTLVKSNNAGLCGPQSDKGYTGFKAIFEFGCYPDRKGNGRRFVHDTDTLVKPALFFRDYL